MIQKLNLVNFRGHTKEIVFSAGLNYLKGPNESGKSTIKEAIAFTWLGTDAAGTKNPDHLITKDKQSAETAITTTRSTIMRSKRLGATSKIKLLKSGGVPFEINQSDLQISLKLTPDAFMSCWSVGFFMDLKTDRKLAVMSELAKLDKRTLLQNSLPSHITIPAKVKLANPRVDADAVAGDRRQDQNKIASNTGALSQVVAQLQQLQGAETADTESFQGRLNEVNVALEEHVFYDKALAQHNTLHAKWEGQQKQIKDWEAELKALPGPTPSDTIARLQTERKQLLEKIAEYDKEHQRLQRMLKAIPGAPEKPDVDEESECTACGQTITKEYVQTVIGKYEEKLVAYNKLSREIETENEKVRAAQSKSMELWSNAVADEQRRGDQLEVIVRDNEDVDLRSRELKEKLNSPIRFKKSIAPKKPETDREALSKEQLELSTALNVARRHETQLHQLKANQDLLTKSNVELQKRVEDFAVLEQALRKLPETETRELLKTLEVTGVDVELSDGEIIVSHKGIPYGSLSSGRKMKVDLEFCKSLRRAAGANAPTWLFFDNSDLVDRFSDLLPTNLQVFVAKVDPELTELTVVGG